MLVIDLELSILLLEPSVGKHHDMRLLFVFSGTDRHTEAPRGRDPGRVDFQIPSRKHHDMRLLFVFSLPNHS